MPVQVSLQCTVVGISAHIHASNPLLFRIIPIKLYGNKQNVTVLAFLDEGASVTLMEAKLADRLGIVGTEEKLTLKWTADYSRTEKFSRKMNVWASPATMGDKMLLRTVRTVGKLRLPHQKMNAIELKARYTYMLELPIHSYEGQPEILIGLNNVHAFAPVEVKVGTIADPIAVRFKLGWTVYGPKIPNTEINEGYICTHDTVSNEDLHDLLKRHYTLEESMVTTTPESEADKRAVAIMERTTKRIGERFQTGLLWKTDDPRFPENIEMALHRNLQLEKRLMKNPQLHSIVQRQIEEYVHKGYAHVATKEELENTEPGKALYLPISVVLDPKKPGKVRIVWDAAASLQGISLNSQLLKGPDLLIPLIAVITVFRERRIAFGGDLREMFHQLKIIKEDRQAQRFLFRFSPKEDPKVYVMDVAIFGSTCSPSSAQFVKNRNAEEHASRYPEAADAIINRHYVDDYFDSVDTIQEAVTKAKQVKLIHKNGGFDIRHWVSNAPDVLSSLGEEKPITAIHFNRDKETLKERVLRIVWNPILDEFSFSTKQREELNQYLHEGKKPTKRIALSCVMGFFDPLGLLSLFTIHGKIVLQHLWRKGCNWDTVVDEEGWRLWRRWVGLLPDIEAIRIPRCFIGNALSTEIESLDIHVFTDSSEHAYGCVAFLRALINGKVHCSLIMSRAKVAPLKRQSIPRLELMAALLGARISQTILRMLTLRVSRCILWTDSRTVCSWLKSDTYKYKQFIALRIGEILELTRVSDWRWVPTRLNIADVLTKWGRGPPLQSDSEWFRGPAFLFSPEHLWPSSSISFGETDEDIRGIVLFHEIIAVETISKWSRLLRVTATVLRFLENCKRRRQGLPILSFSATTKLLHIIKTSYPAVQHPLQQSELSKAEKVLWKQAQWDSFPDEMSVLSHNLQLASDQKADRISKTSGIYKYSPTLDEDGVLRVDGRLTYAENLSFNQKYPVILSRFHSITKKIIQYYHEQFGHANKETVFNEMRKMYEIPNLRAAISKVSSECVWCKVHRCVPYSPRMAPLPVQRVTPGKRPFNSVGVDYLGPVEVTVGRRKEKRWIAIFTCLVVRAVHLEVVHSLSTQSCLMAISRFASRFGKPAEIFSDNATCFRGAWNDMVKAKSKIHQQCAESIISTTTTWYFNPPETPHMGGIWERMVRSVKEAMKVLNDGRKINDEILMTTIAETADMINTRPLTYKPQDPAGEEALTPNHFIRGTITSADLQVDSVSAAEALRDTYKRAQFLSDRIWERWIIEYLPTINKRSKWLDEKQQLSVGDLVFLVNGNNRKCWKRGKIVEVYPGLDGIIRQASVRTADRKVYRREVVKIAVLEIDGKSGTT
ncbi:uncharacterized protein LOC131434306 [Malaya genurostris]|uniref:uncharacterized protein LOC131434306 n=1 Tax=Malaya genurostris TaxID=325434 RepID=UPI0026F3C9F3|nr:uncharacterized protein LOC131434306 [Malaya genurostris]